jgi:hypothetical protein
VKQKNRRLTSNPSFAMRIFMNPYIGIRQIRQLKVTFYLLFAMNASVNLFDISIADARKLGQEKDRKSQITTSFDDGFLSCEIDTIDDYQFTSNFSDGICDGENNFKPITYQWFNSDYRRGYLVGVARRMGIKRT